MCPGMLHVKFHISGGIQYSLFLRNGQNLALLWPKHIPNMVPQIGSSLILIDVPRDVPCQISLCWVYAVAPFPRNGKNMALLLPKYGPHMVHQIDSSWILINVPGDVPSQISQCWVYPVAPFPRNGQNMAFNGQNMVLTWSLELVLPKY